MENEKNLQLSLLLLRLSVFLVMFMWTIDKFLNPEHASKVYESFYFVGGLDHIAFYTLGGVEMIILLLFLVGYKKKFSYGAVLVFHTISTLSSFKIYLAPFEGPGLLFFAAWPMLAACITLFLLRDHDTLMCHKTKEGEAEF